MRCGVGHKPRFYLPKYDMHGENWGYKRKCADYVHGTPEGLKPVEIISVTNVQAEPRPIEKL